MALQVTDVERLTPGRDYEELEPKRSRWGLLAAVAAGIVLWTVIVIGCLWAYGKFSFYVTEYRIMQQVILYNVQQGHLALPPGMSLAAPPPPPAPAIVQPTKPEVPKK